MDNNKLRIKYNTIKRFRRIMCIWLIFLLVLELVPISDTGVFRDAFWMNMTAYALENSEFPHDSQNVVRIPIDKFVRYSLEFDDAQLAAYHQNDKIIITNAGAVEEEEEVEDNAENNALNLLSAPKSLKQTDVESNSEEEISKIAGSETDSAKTSENSEEEVNSETKLEDNPENKVLESGEAEPANTEPENTETQNVENEEVVQGGSEAQSSEASGGQDGKRNESSDATDVNGTTTVSNEEQVTDGEEVPSEETVSEATPEGDTISPEANGEEENGDAIGEETDNSEIADSEESEEPEEPEPEIIIVEEQPRFLAGASGGDSGSNIALTGFRSLGTETSPFKGSITLDSNFTATFNLDCPLFDYVYDSVTINNGSAINISRRYKNDTIDKKTPIIANYILHDTTSGAVPASWAINVVPDKTEQSSIALSKFAGFIGELEDNAVLTVTLDLSVDSQETSSDKSISIEGRDGIGLVCKKIGTGASLTCSLSGDRDISQVSTVIGNAGGLVGTMEANSHFIYTQTRNTSFIIDDAEIRTDNGDYAGGLVGYNDGGEVTVTMPAGSKYVVKQKIKAAVGVGGIYGFFVVPQLPAGTDEWEINADAYDIDCTLNGDGACGGLVGIMESAYPVSFVGASTKTLIKTIHAVGSGDNSCYGGVIGKYTSLERAGVAASQNSLVIKNIKTNISKNEGGVFYAGGIALVEGNSYVNFDSFELVTATNASNLTFGGLVAKGEKAFVDANNVKITVAGNIKGGGLVGNIGDGVLRLRNTIDLSGAASASDADHSCYVGQIVGFRDDALIFSEQNTTVIKRTPLVQVDDIGAWGEYLRFDGTSSTTSATTNSFGSNQVLSVNEDTHQITVNEPGLAVGTVADFAKVALCMQLDTNNSTGNPFVTISGSNTYNTLKQSGVTITLTEDIDLTGTGLTGFTRDNDTTSGGAVGTDKCYFAGTFDGGNYTVTLAIGDTSTGFNGNIYRHKYNGLFGVLSGGTVQNVTFDGTVNVKSPSGSKAFVGAAASRSTGTFTANNVNVNTVFNVSGAGDLLLGRLLGEASDSSGNIAITCSEFSGNVVSECVGSEEAEKSTIGGAIGKISRTGAFTATFDGVITSGEIWGKSSKKNQSIAGLIGEIVQGGNIDSSSRKVVLKKVDVEGLIIKGALSTEGTMGGLLGYSWLRTDVFVGSDASGVVSNATGVSIDEDSKVDLTGAGKIGGLVYKATGYWDVKKLDNSMIVDASSAKSLGMIVNQGKHDNDGLYLALNDGYHYDISQVTFTNLSSTATFDELLAYSAPEGAIMTNGQAIVSIHIPDSTGGGLVMDGNSSNYSKSYIAQTSKGAVPNPNTRYYYNLDTITGSASDSPAFSGTNANQNKLMSWGVRTYAADNIKSRFYNAFSNGTVGTSGADYDMQGYSWYPVNVDSALTVNGNYKFYNSEFETNEEATDGTSYSYFRTSHYDSVKNTYTQHRMMQNAMFHNVSAKLTIGTVKLSGNVAVPKANEGSGALISGTVAGTTDKVTEVSVSGSLNLDGIRIANHANNTYSPLLINKVGSNVELKIAHITATGSNYVSDNVTSTVASSLIGKVGGSDAVQLKVDFSDIMLDGRNNSSNTDLDNVYSTKRSIFSKATLMESFGYKANSGSTGVYKYTYAEDWSGETHLGKVTYGSELSDAANRKEYYGEEFWYSGEDHSSGKYVSYTSGSASAKGDFSGFLPYVYQVYGNDYHQLQVNHTAGTFGGCGTYNHPYEITSGSDLATISQIINGNTANLDANYKIRIDSDRSDIWCAGKTGCTEYYYNSGVFSPVTGSGNISLAVVREYLASAYYSINDDIDLDATFLGLGNADTNKYVFRGVISGNGHTITNKSTRPLIYASYGSVVYNLKVKEDCSIELDQGDQKPFNITSANGCQAYGSVIGRIMGGDNIIDNVQISYGESSKFTLKGNYAQIIPVGGYVGVIVNGALIFREMEELRGTDSIKGLAMLDSSKIKNNTSSTDFTVGDNTYKVYETGNTKWLYVNPIIGRVINGYAVTETDYYRPFEEGVRIYPDKSKDYCVETTGEGDAGEGDAEEGDEKEVTIISEDNYSNQKLSKVTMRNGTKNYSITDINKDADIMSMDGGSDGSTVTVKNAQSVFIMSLLTQSNTSVSNNGKYNNDQNLLKPYDDYMSTHLSAYRYVGDSDLNGSTVDNSTSATAEAKADYLLAASDLDGAGSTNNSEKVPYVIKEYTPYLNSTCPYPAFDLSGFTTYATPTPPGKDLYLNMVFAKDGEKTYYIPDGFRGLGSITIRNSKTLTNSGADGQWYDNSRVYHAMALYSLTGNNTTISMNMELLTYQDNKDNYRAPFATNQGFMKTGFGFFTCLRSKYTSNSSRKIKDLVLKGKVKYDIIDSGTGLHLICTNENGRPSVGALAGAPGGDTKVNNKDDGGGGSIYVENVRLENMYVYGQRIAGGLFGCSNSNQQYYFYGCSADNLEIYGGTSLGGLIGYVRNGSTKIDADFQNKEFGIISIKADANTAGNSDNAPTSVGGLFGNNHCDTNGSCAIYIRNVTIKAASGATDGKAYIGHAGSNSTYVSAGGVEGSGTRRCYMRLENVTVENVNISGGKSGGLIGDIGANSNNTYNIPITEVINCKVETNKNCSVVGSNSASGGLIGRININDASKKTTIDNCIVKDYTIVGNNNQGGLIGTTTGTDFATIASNVMVDGVLIKTDLNGGSVVGNINNGLLNGYNIATNNITFEKNSGGSLANSNNYGYLVGKNNSKVIKIAGFSRQADTVISRDRMVGNYEDTGTNRYGTGGYVIFADFDGSSFYDDEDDGTDTRNKVMSTVNATNPPTANATNVVVPEGSVAYVTMNPKLDIESNASPKYLTGDGINNETFANIKNDTTSNKKYSAAISSFAEGTYNSSVAAIANNLSTSTSEFGNVSGIPQFPLLIIEDINPDNTSKLINDYLRMLTNTSYTFDADINHTNKNGRGYVFDVDLVKMTYDGDSFEPNGAACLKIIGDKFGMNVTDVDSGETPQFSLIDLKFYDPSNQPVYNQSGGNYTLKTAGKVAYHVYVPTYVRRIRRFNFTAKIDAGTEYFYSHYTNAPKAIFENLGNPITMECEYTYERSADDWKVAINEGEDVMTNYFKRLQIQCHVSPRGWPEGTKLVLVDPNNQDKFYYMDNPDEKITFGAQDGIGYLDLYDFEDENENNYSPANFCDLFEGVTVTQTSTGTLTTVGATAENATFRYLEGDHPVNLRPVASAVEAGLTVNDNEKYTISSIQKVNPERYYLSFFMPKKADQKVYRYEISSVDANSKTVSEKWTIPESKWSANKIRNNSTVDLFTGNLFTNQLVQTTGLDTDTKDHSTLMGEENSYIEVSLESKVELTQAAITNHIDDNLKNATNAHVYQSFLISMDMLKEAGQNSIIGIMGSPKTTSLDSYQYKVGSDGTWTNIVSSEKKVVNYNNSFLELRSGKDIRNDLGTNHQVSFKVKYDMLYESENIPEQFPKGIFDGETLTNGTKVIGYSNLGSSLEGVSYSANSDRRIGEKSYYTTSSTLAKLTYNVDEDPYINFDEGTDSSAYLRKAGPYSMIGINPIEDTGTNMYVSTHAIYDVSKLTTNAEYVRMRLSLRKRSDSYNEELNLNTYISDWAIYGEGSQVLNASQPGANDTEYIIVVPRSQLLPNPDTEGEYYIPITYKIKTGTTFEGENLEYSNYMVKLEIEMTEDVAGQNRVQYSDAFDHIIYTNAKVQPKVIQQP